MFKNSISTATTKVYGGNFFLYIIDMASKKKNMTTRSDRLLNDAGQKIWDELAKEYGPRALKRVASAAMATFQRLPHEGRVKAFEIIDGKDVELTIQVIPDGEELERLLWRAKQLKKRLDKKIAQEKKSGQNPNQRKIST